MKKIVFLFIILILVPHLSFAQKQGQPLIDSLLSELPKAKEDTNKILLLNDLTFEYYAINPDEGIKYGKMELALSEKLGWKKGKGKAYSCLGTNYYAKSDYNIALDYYFKALKIGEELKLKKVVASTLGNIGSIYNALRNHEKAVEYYLKALSLYHELGEKEGIARYLGNLGNEYLTVKNYSKALEYQQNALKLSEEIHDKSATAMHLGNIGVSLELQNDYVAALPYFFKSLKMYEELGVKAGIGRNLGNIGESYFGMAKNNNYRRINELSEGIKYTKMAIAINSEIAELKSLRDNYSSMTEMMELLGNYKEALIYNKKVMQLNDSIFSVEKTDEIARNEIRFIYEKRALADSVKANEEKKVIDAELKQEQTKSYTLFFGVALLMIFGGIMFNRYKVTQKQKNTIEIKEKETQKQKSIIEEKQKEILGSIEYALRIQTAILPPNKIVNLYLENSFILYKPKDIVAGDFYWLETVQLHNSPMKQLDKEINQLILFAACDCTGHGVPGAMVSVVCHNALNRAVREFGLTQPAAILDKTSEIVKENFSKSEEEIKDGMDISLCAYNPKTNKLQWAGANNPLWLLQNGEIIETKADKQPIGRDDNSKPFTNHTFTLQQGDTIYLFTDGFADQFGGDTGRKKLTKKRFKDLILSFQNKSLPEQGDALDRFITDYRKDIEQIDDILVIGVKI